MPGPKDQKTFDQKKIVPQPYHFSDFWDKTGKKGHSEKMQYMVKMIFAGLFSLGWYQYTLDIIQKAHDALQIPNKHPITDKNARFLAWNGPLEEKAQADY